MAIAGTYQPPELADLERLAKEHGWHLFPTEGKQPMRGVKWRDESTDDPARLARWHAITPPQRDGFAVDCGKSGVVVVDLDRQHWADQNNPKFLAIKAQLIRLAGGNGFRAPSGGWHVYFAASPDVELRNTKLAQKPGAFYEKEQPDWIETRATGGMMRLTADAAREMKFPLQPVPFSVIACSKPTGMPEGVRRELLVRQFCDDLANTPEGGRNDKLNKVAFSIFKQGYHDAGTISALARAAAECGLEQDESRTTIESALAGAKAAGAVDPGVGKARRSRHLRDIGGRTADEIHDAVMAHTRRDDAGKKLPYIYSDIYLDLWKGTKFFSQPKAEFVKFEEGGVWLEWDDDAKQWPRLTPADMVQRSNLLIRVSGDYTDAHRARSRKAMHNAMTADCVVGDTNLIDANPYMALDAAGVAIDLRTGKPTEQREDMPLMRRFGAKYIPDAPLPKRWLRFVHDAHPDPEKADYFIFSQAYGLEYGNPLELLFNWWGDGGNGKGTSQNLNREILGTDFFLKKNPAAFLEQKNPNANPRKEFEEMEGARVVFLEELPKNARWNMAVLKNASGEKDIQVQSHYRSAKPIKVSWKITAQGNIRGKIQEMNTAVIRRWRHFDWNIVPSRLDANLLTELLVEKDLIFTHWLKVLAKWHAETGGRVDPAPKSVLDASLDYIEQGATEVDKFMHAATRKAPGSQVALDELAEIWLTWRVENDYDISREKTPPWAIKPNFITQLRSTRRVVKGEGGKLFLPDVELVLRRVRGINDALEPVGDDEPPPMPDEGEIPW